MRLTEIFNAYISHHQISLIFRTMKLSILLFYISTLLATSYSLPCYGTKDCYIRRLNSPQVKAQLIEYWSRPEVLIRMPDEMRHKVMEYVKQNPQFRWVPTKGKIRRMMQEWEKEEEESKQQSWKAQYEIPRSTPPSEDEG
jgi:hypothetical protein